MKKTILFISFLSFLLTACERKLVDHIDLIPQVETIKIESGTFNLSTLTSIQVPEEWKEISSAFVSDLSLTYPLKLQAVQKSASLQLVKDTLLAKEEYQLMVDEDEIVLKASQNQGIIYALTTLRQLIMRSEGGVLPVLTLQDKPQYGYRGLMLDCSRHFWTVDELEKTIHCIAFFKLNYLHLHLTDNNAWRMEIEKYPNLVKAGNYYRDYPELSGKYYTKEDMKRVVRYASLRGVEIIPEIDFPGHAIGLLAAYPEYSCKGGKFEAYPEESPWRRRLRTNEDMVCVGNPKIYDFIADVVDELSEIFPSKYIHLGGNGVRFGNWSECTKCKALCKREHLDSMKELQDYFTEKVTALVKSKGKVVIGWDDINERGVATSDNVLTIWHDDGVVEQDKALAQGVPVIMCPQHGCYFDLGYSGNSTRKAYEWDPAPLGVTSEQHKLIMGGQAVLWTDRIMRQLQVEWMLFPRICALAEVLWTPSSRRDWNSFQQRLIQLYPAMKQLGINFYEDMALNEQNFVPTSRKPVLVQNAVIETNIPVNSPYHSEYAFDGKTNSFFWGSTSVGKGHYFQLNLEEAKKLNEIYVLTGDSKDYITKADLLVSEDGVKFEKVAAFDIQGTAKAILSGRRVKHVRIEIREQHACWPIIREIILK